MAQKETMSHGDTIYIDACASGSGVIFDDGGSTGNYSNNFAGWVKITAPEGVTITLTGSYHTESPNCDWIDVWDGEVATGTCVVSRAGGTGTINTSATSGTMVIYYRTDGSVTSSGFELEWACEGWSATYCSSGITSFAATSITSTTAILHWTASATNLLLDYGQGAQPVSGGTATLTSLNPNTLYTVRLYAGEEEGSACCVARTSFRTGCGAMAAPMVERFDDLTADEMPPCWSMGKNFDDATLFPRVSTVTALSGSKSLMLSSGDNTTATHFGMVMSPNITTAIASLTVHVSLRANMNNAKVEIGLCDTVSGLFSHYGFTPVDTLVLPQNGQWYEFAVPLTEYSGNGTRLALRMMQGLQPSGGCIVYIDDLMVENCGVDELWVNHIGTDEVTLNWNMIGNPSVTLTVSAGETSTSYNSVTSPYRITGLDADTRYTLTLTPQCGGVFGEAKSTTANTLAGDTMILQFCEQFESGWPAAIRRTEQYDNHPLIANNDGNRMRLRNYGTNHSTAVFPRAGENTPVGSLSMAFQMRPDYAGDGVVVGVLEYPDEMSSFTPVDTVTATATWGYHIVSFDSYNGSGHYIVLRSYSPTGNSRYIYLDDITIGKCLLHGLTAPRRACNSVTLEWDRTDRDAGGSMEGDVVVEYGPVGFALGNGTTVTVTPQSDGLETLEGGRMRYTVRGLDSATTYQFAAYRQCGEEVCNPLRVTASTYMHNYTVPFCERFDEVTGDNYVYLSDWGRPTMFDGRPCLWQYDDAPTSGRVLDLHSRGMLQNGYEHSVAVLPHLDYEGALSNLTVSFMAKFNSDNYTPYLEVGVITDPADESTFIPVDTVHPAYRTFTQYAVSLAGYSGGDGHIALRYYHNCNGCYLTMGLDNLEVRSAAIDQSDVYSERSDGATVAWNAVGNVGNVNLRIIQGNDTTTLGAVSNPYTITGLLPGTLYRYELDYGQCYPVGGSFTTNAEAVHADWCYGFEAGHNNGRYPQWTYPMVYGTGSGERHRGSYAMYLQAYGGNATAAAMPYIEEDDYTGLTLSFMAKQNGYGHVVIGLAADPRDTAGMHPIDTITERDNVWRLYELDLSGLEQYGHHVMFCFTNRQELGCYPCNSYIDIDDMRLDRGNRISSRSYVSTASSADITWSATDATDSVHVVLTLEGQIVFDSTAAADNGGCHIEGLLAAKEYTLILEALAPMGHSGCDPTPGTLRTLDHDVADGFCERCESSFSVLPEGWAWLADGGRQPWFDFSDRFGSRKNLMSMHADSRADAYTMLISPRLSVPPQGLVAGFSAWYNTEEPVQAAYIVAGVMTNPSDAASFTALDTFYLTNFLQRFAVDLSAYNGSGRYLAFKGMSLEGYDRDMWLTDVSLSTCLPARLRVSEVTASSFNLRWDMIGSTDSVIIRLNSLADTTVAADQGFCRFESLQPGASYTVRMVGACQQWQRECQWQETSVQLPGVDIDLPACMPLANSGSTQLPWNYQMPTGWTRPYGNSHPRYSGSGYRDNMEFYAYRCDNTNDMSSMAVSPYFPQGFDGLWLDFYFENNNLGNILIVGSMSDPADTASFSPRDTLAYTYPRQHISLNLSGYGGHYLAFRYLAASPCNSGHAYLSSPSFMHCPLPVAWLSHQEDTSVHLNWNTSDPVWVEYQMGPDFPVGQSIRQLAASSPHVIGGLSPAANYTFHVWPQCPSDTFLCNYNTLHLVTMHPPVAMPYCYNFENIGNSEYPQEWSRWTPDATYCAATSSDGHGDSHSLHIVASSSRSATAIAPRIDPSSLCNENIYINFWARCSSGQEATLLIGSVSDLSDTLSFSSHDTLLLSPSWQNFTATLPRSALAAGRAAFRLLPGADILLDNLCIEQCVAANIQVTNITQHSATISWQSFGVDTLLVEYGPSGFEQGSGNILRLTTSPYTVTGLAASSQYSFLFRPLCSCPSASGSVYPAGGGSHGTTWWDGIHITPFVWIDTALFPQYTPWGVGYGPSSGGGLGDGGGLVIGTQTQAEMLPTPLCEDFDTLDLKNIPLGWRRIPGSAPGYPQAVRTPVSSGTRSIDLYTSPGHANILALPPVADPSRLILALDAYCDNSEPQNRHLGVLVVGVMTHPDLPATFSPVDTLALSASNSWQRLFVDLSAYSDSGHYIALRFSPRNSSYHLYLDNLYLGSAAVTSASAAPSPDGIVITYSTIGRASSVILQDSAGYSASLTASPALLPDLSPDGHYQLTLRAVSDSDTQSLCHLPLLLVNPVMQTPYCETFDSPGPYPDGWTLKHRRPDEHTAILNGYMQFSMDPSNPTLFLLPPLPIGQTLSDLVVSFDFHANSNTTWNSTYTYLDFGYLVDTADSSYFVTLATAHTDAVSAHILLTLPPTTASRLAIRARSTYDWHVFDIDNLVISPQPFPSLADLSSPNLGYALKRFSWSSSHHLAPRWRYEWGPAGFQPGTGTIALSDSSSLTIHPLLPATDYDLYFIDSAGHYPCSPLRFVTSSPLPLPYCDQFDQYGSSYNSRPSGWTYNIPSDAELYCTSDYDHSLRLHSSYYGSSHIYAVLPELDTLPLSSLSLFLRYQFRDQPAIAEIGTLSASDDWNSFLPIDTLPCNLNQWTELSLSLPSSTSSRRFLALRLKGNIYQYNTLLIDRIAVQQAPIPDYIPVAASAILAHIDTPNPDYYLQLCPPGTPQGLGRTLHVTSPDFLITDLQPSTTYNIYTSTSPSDPACLSRSVTTPHLQPLPYCEQFDSFGECYNCRPPLWTYSTSNDDQNYTVQGNSWSLRFYSYYYNTHYVYASLPDLDAADTRSLALEMRYRFEGNPCLAELGLVRSPGEWSTFTPVDTLQTPAANVWYTLRHNFADDTTGYRFLAIRMLGTQYQYNYLYIDYMHIQACPLPRITLSGYNTIRCALDNASPAADYWVHISDGDIMDSLLHITSNPYHITDLSTGTTYTLSAQCDSVTPSCFPSTVITTGQLQALPYCEQFDSYGTGNGSRPDGWTLLTNSPDDQIYTYSANNYSLFFRSYYYNQNTLTAVLPDLDIDSLRHASVELRYRYESYSCPAWIGIQTDPSDPSTFTPIHELQGRATNTWYTEQLSLASYTGNGRFLAIRMQGNNTYYKYLYIDYINIQSIPLVHLALPEATTIAAVVDSTVPADYWLHYSQYPRGVPSLTVADGTATNGYVPVYGYYTDNYLRCQMIYPASMLTTMAGGTIEGLTFYSSTTNTTWNNTSFQVSMAEVPQTSFATTAWSSAELTQVYSGSLYISGGQMSLVFDEPFSYHGGNLLVEVVNSAPGSYQSAYFYGIVSTGASLQGNNSISVGSINPSQRNFLPKTKFSYKAPEGADDVTTHVHVSTGSLPITDLDENTTYYFLATPTDSMTSCWPWVSVTTSQLRDVPYCENFDQTPTSSSALPSGWLGFTNGATGYPKTTHSWTFESSTGALLMNANSGSRCYAVLPQPDIPTLEGISLTFRFQPHNPYHTSVGVIVGTMTDPYDISTFVAIDTVMNNAEGYQPHQVTLTGGTPNGTSFVAPHYVAFMEYNTSGSNLDAYIDNITLTTCNIPIDTRATLSGPNIVQIDGSPSSTGFYVEYGPTGFAQGTGTVEHIDITPYDIPLDYETTYDFYFLCDADVPSCSPAQTVTTLTPPLELPYCEDFDSYANNTIPTDWKKYRLPEEYGNDVFIYSDQGHSPSRSLRFCSAYTDRHPYAVLPALDVDSLKHIAISFWMRNAHSSSFSLDVGTVSNPYDMSTFVPLRTFTNSNDNEWQRMQAVLNNAPSDAHYLALRFNTTMSSWDWLYIDDLHIDTSGASDLHITSIESESVTLDWNQVGNPSVTLDIIPLDGQPTSQLSNLNTHITPPYTVQGLSPLTSYIIRFNSTSDNPQSTYCTTEYSDSVHFFTPAGGTGCIDPTNLTADYASCFIGSYRNPYATLSMVDSGAASSSSRHTVHFDPTETDPRTGGQLHTVPAGASASVRLGNWGAHKISNAEGGEAEAISYALYVDTMAFDLLILRYAAVMQDPMHAPQDQPRFRLQLLDSTMNLIDPLCGAADFIANQDLGWNTVGDDHEVVLWKDWTTVGLDLSPYAGQTIYIRLTTYDCNEGSHFGYAYFTLDCMRKSLSAEGCGNVASNLFTAPSGFDYRWYSNQSDSTLSSLQTINVPSSNDITYYCDLSFVDNHACNFTMSAFAGTRFPLSLFDSIVTVADCQFQVAFRNLSTISMDGTTPVGSAEGVETAVWNFGNGNSSSSYHASTTYETEGTYTITLVTSIAGGACTDTIQKDITLRLPPTNPHIVGPEERCYGAPADTLAIREATAWSPWSDSTLLVAPSSDTTYTLLATDSNGCRHTLTHPLAVHPVFNDTLSATICQGESYTFGNSLLSQATVETHNLSTALHGCDSIVTLLLAVNDNTDTTIIHTIADSLLPYTFNGITFNDQTNGQLIHLDNAAGCDSLINFSLAVIWNNKVTHIDSTVCHNHLPLSWHGITIADTGTYSVRLSGAHGEDSTLYLHLHSAPVYNDTIPYSICDNETLSFEGQTFGGSDAGLHSFSLLTSSYACDSLRTLNLSVRATTFGDTVANVCDTFLWYGTTYTTSTDAPTHLSTNAAQCDSTTTLHLTVRHSTTSSVNETIVENQLPYTFNGVTFTDSSDLTLITIPNAAGCDSLISYSLHIDWNTGSRLDSNICFNQLPISWNGASFDTTVANTVVMRTVVIPSSAGSDSTIIMRLHVRPVYNDTIPYSICDNETLSFEGQSFGGSDAGLHSFSLLTDNYACDSLRTLNLSVRATTFGDTVANVCDTFLWYGTTYTASTDAPTHLSTNASQCDSTTTLHLTVRHSTTSSVNETIVENQLPYTFNGVTFTDSSDLTLITIPNAAGCDSLISYSLHVDWNTGSRLDSNICFNQLPISWNGASFDTTVANTVVMRTVVIPSAAGSDSTIIMRLHVRPVYNDTIPYSICDNETFSFEGQSFGGSDAGLHSFHLLTDTYACDSLRTLNLSVRATTFGDTVANVCDTFLWYGTTYTASTDAPTHLSTNAALCDSTTTLHLTVRRSTTSSVNETIVENQLPYTFNGVTFTDSSDLTLITIPNAAGCDSLISYSLHVDWNTGSRLDSNICFNQLPISWNGASFDTTVANTVVMRTVVIPSAAGSDSTIIMRLHVRPVYNDTIPYSICDNETFSFEGQSFGGSDAGLHSFHLLTDTYACDSLRTLNLSVRATTFGDTVANVCDTFSWYGTTYTASTDAPTHLSTNAAQCDSTTTLHLTVRHSTTSSVNETIVENQLPYTFNGVTFTDSSDLTLITIPNAAGCDSLISYSLHVDWNTGSRLDSNICFNQLPISWNGASFDTTIANTVVMRTVVIPSSTGSDSTIIMRLHVRPIYNDTIPYSICDNETLSFEGQTFGGSDAGLHSFSLLTSSYACDSLRTLNLSVRATTFGDTVANVCDTFSWYGTTYTASTDAPTHLSTNAALCDSTTTLHLTVRRSTTSSINETIVENQLPYTFNGVTFTDSSDLTLITIPNAAGCDSLISYSLHVDWNTGSRLDSNICFNQLPISWNGASFDTTIANTVVMRTVVIPSSAGSDSTIVMHLHVRPIYNDTIPYSICDNETFSFEGQTFGGSDAGLHSFHLLTDNYACDSLRTLNLSVRATTFGDTVANVCDTFLWYGTTYTASTDAPTHLSTNAALCDSTTTLHLTVRRSTTSLVTDTIVQNQLPWSYHDSLFADSVSHTTVVFPNAVLCDSIVDYTLHVFWNVDTAIYDTLCNDALPTTWNGVTFDTAVAQTSTLTRSATFLTSNGADSVVVMHLTVHALYDHHTHSEICDNQEYTFGDSTFLGSDGTTVHLDSLLSMHGCDSLSTLHLTVHPTYDHHHYDTLCTNQSYTWGTPQRQMFTPGAVTQHLHGSDSLAAFTLADSPFRQDSVYTDHLTSSHQCDSLSSLHLHLLPAFDLHYYDTICSGQWVPSTWQWTENSYPFMGDSHDTTGTYAYQLNTATCDSLRTLHLKVYPIYEQHIYDTIYDGDTYTFENHTFDTTGVYPVALDAVYACDSIRILHLQRNRRTYLDTTLCQNQLPLVWNTLVFRDGTGQRQGAVQILADSIHLRGRDNIDSLVVMTLTVHDTSATTLRIHACDSLVWEDGNAYFASTASPQVTYNNQALCDSVVHLDLTVDYTHYFTDRHTVCDSMLWINGLWYLSDTAGVVDTIATVAGCDSVVTLDLTVHYSTSTALRDTICHNETYTWHQFTVHSDRDNLTEEFPLTDTLRTIHGCDSVVGMIVTKMALPTITFSPTILCHNLHYTLAASALAPLHPGADAQQMPYIQWSSVPADDLLDGQEHLATVDVMPRSATEYILYADYQERPLCPATASVTLNPVIVPEAIMKVNPQALGYNKMDFEAYDISHQQWDRRTWYLDGNAQSETGPTFSGQADHDADSVVIALEVYNGMCYDTALQVLPVNRVSLYAPNAITPLRDDNNRFEIVTQGVLSGELYIYNREGLLIYYTPDYTRGWNGVDQNGRTCLQGNYVWKLIYRAVDRPSADQVEVGTLLVIH